MYRNGVYNNQFGDEEKKVGVYDQVKEIEEYEGKNTYPDDVHDKARASDVLGQQMPLQSRRKHDSQPPKLYSSSDSPKDVSTAKPRNSSKTFRDKIHEIDHGEAQFADLKRQLEEIEVEDHLAQEYGHTRRRSHPMEDQHLAMNLTPSARRPQIRESPQQMRSSSDEYVSDTSSEDSPIAYSPKRTSSISSKPHSSTSSSRHESRRSSATASSLQKGLREARHFAGGIIHHPSESTKHYSILRHSHGLVFYQGTATSLAISVFADTPLPPNRTFWLQPKHWSTTATFRQQNDTLHNVTPETPVKAEQLNPNDERAWQRDIIEFERRVRHGSRSRHVLRETVVVRIPAEAVDGYFQLALSLGQREEILCVSPVFRILSISPNMGAISGAHWATLPLEVGAMALSIQAKTVVGSALLPVKIAAKGRAQTHMPSKVTSHATHMRMAGKMAYGATGVAEQVGAHVKDFNNAYDVEREGPFTPVFKIDDDYEHGPKYPYPVRFTARCDDEDANVLTERSILPVSTLTNITGNTTYRLIGYYFGWCNVPTQRKSRDGRIKKRNHWYQTIIAVLPINICDLDHISISRANEKKVQLQVLSETPKHLAPGTEVEVAVLGCIRPWDQELEKMIADDMKAGDEIAFETAYENEISDIKVAQMILDHPAWGPEALESSEEEKESSPKKHGMERIKQEYAEKRLAVQKKIDRVPLHKIGVRMPVDTMRDKLVVVNGYYVER